MATYDRGTPVLIEAEFKRNEPFGGPAYFDPTSPKVTVTAPDGTVMVDGAAMTKQETGKWYHIFQTDISWEKGPYNVKITCSDGTYNDVTVARGIFRLL
ncbi:MAG: hypothetical protein GXP46_01950 [Deferribacteres bacterium]|nr:hypothetical protein [Deferribacteres bacterium]